MKWIWILFVSVELVSACVQNLTMEAFQHQVVDSGGTSLPTYSYRNVADKVLRRLVWSMQKTYPYLGGAHLGPLQEQHSHKTWPNKYVRLWLQQKIREESPDLKYQFEISSLPTIILIRNHKFWTFTGNYTTKELSDFALKGYNAGVKNDLKPPKNFLEKLIFIISQNIESFIKTLDKLGLAFAPRPLKLAAVIVFLFSPILAVLLCIWLTRESEAEQVKAKGEEEKKADVAKAKKEKQAQ
eukprot:TRINITY_DN1300_c0_g1_i1.p8 TRINITY_DN1300_c0_g1~~TRINITY_DN1300_c0_g1_i1.p8  ORF type:complete len:241 (+),score=22.80 TRINITY_DN1300_c0_g1_i1:4003-4725(+)